MYKIAVMGDRDSVLAFKALGLDVYFAEKPDEAQRTLHALANGGEYAVIYITEQLSLSLRQEIDRYKDRITPAIILIPGRGGALGLAEDSLQRTVERAVGADIS